MTNGDRHSRAVEPQLIADPDEQARVEAANGLKQFDQVVEFVRSWTGPDARPFRLRPSMILALQRTALEGLSSYAGNFRPASVTIGQSKHTPPGAYQVAELVEDMCDYVNENWHSKTAAHLASYVMWRLNWIHPFADGNGRTSRALSYMILCIRSGHLLPGAKTIPEQISQNKKPYYEALEAADETLRETGEVDVSRLEALLSAALAAQLADHYRVVTGDRTSVDN